MSISGSILMSVEAEFVVKVARDLLGNQNVTEMKPLLGSEDFSFYLQKVPGSFVFLGTKNVAKGSAYPHHHPRFDIDEDVLPIGTALNVAIALQYLKETQG
jgi:metal-dependent amidase/aminoacylase/carboxypeptidase family protein